MCKKHNNTICICFLFTTIFGMSAILFVRDPTVQNPETNFSGNSVEYYTNSIPDSLTQHQRAPNPPTKYTK